MEIVHGWGDFLLGIMKYKSNHVVFQGLLPFSAIPLLCKCGISGLATGLGL